MGAITIYAKEGKVINLGRVGEKNARQIVFNVADWIDPFLEENQGTFLLYVHQNGVGYYMVNPEADFVNKTVTWKIKAENTATAGLGKCELAYYIGEPGEIEPQPEDILVKSYIYDIVVTNALDGECADDVPTPIQTWLEEVSHLTEVIVNADEYALRTEGYAAGTQNGVPVTPTGEGSQYYHNNGAYYYQETNNERLIAEGYAVGEQDGQVVPSSSTYWHNNAKYYSNKITQSRIGTTTTIEPTPQNPTPPATVTITEDNTGLIFSFGIPRGQQGQGITIVGVAATSSALPSASSVSAGTAYGVGATAPYDIYISNGSQWYDFGQLGTLTGYLVTWTA